MILPIKRIPDGHSVLSQIVEMSGEQEQWLRARRLTCRAEIDRIRSQLHVQLFYAGTVQVECARCCTLFDLPVQGDFRIMCVHAAGAGKDGGFSKEEIDVVFDDETNEIDLTPFIYEEIVVSLPMKPLCSEQCTGIVLEKQGAAAEMIAENSEAIDPRWEALKKLKGKY
jgi:uncharacterized metal-binding protein YceD (DUF177 family)